MQFNLNISEVSKIFNCIRIINIVVSSNNENYFFIFESFLMNNFSFSSVRIIVIILNYT